MTVVEAPAPAVDLDSWRPHLGMFAPGQPTLDPRVFDVASEQMRSQVRLSVIGALDAFWTPMYGDWRAWAHVYLAGSGASYWWDSDVDFDTLIGIDLDALVAARPANYGLSEQTVCAALNVPLKTLLDPTTAALVFGPGEKPFEVTYFVNPDSYPISKIKPYAAYDMTDDTWVVHPPVLPADWGPSYFAQPVWDECARVARECNQALAIADPVARLAAGTALFDWIHSWRKQAYSENGKGWLDFGNVVYQYLSQRPDEVLRRLYLCKHPEMASPGELAADGLVATSAYGNSTGGTIYRGVRIDPGDDFLAAFKPYEEIEEKAERRSAKAADILLAKVSASGDRHESGLGVHWTERPEFAAGAASAGGRGVWGEMRAIVQATYTADDVEPQGSDAYGLGGVWMDSKTEAEVLIKPGASLAVTGLWVPIGPMNGQVISVDRCPKANWPGGPWANILGAPVTKTAAVPTMDDYRRMREQQQAQVDRPFTGTIREATPDEVEEGLYLFPGVRGLLAIQDGKQIGHFFWNTKTHLIESIKVERRWWRKGIATKLLAEARKIDPAIKHSTDLTNAGRGWAEKVGYVKDCYCCEGKGEHHCGHECYVCDASGQGAESQGHVCEGHHGLPDLDRGPDYGGTADNGMQHQAVRLFEVRAKKRKRRHHYPYPSQQALWLSCRCCHGSGDHNGHPCDGCGGTGSQTPTQQQTQPTPCPTAQAQGDTSAGGGTTTTAALNDEGRVSVAEHVMESSGMAGKTWHVPRMRMDDPARAQAHQPVNDFVHHVLTSHGWQPGGQGHRIRVSPSHWDLRSPGSGQAVTDGMNYIGLKGEDTNDLTLLHECAHVLTGTGEGEGHGPEFIRTLHGLYRDHISPEAADTFARIAMPRTAVAAMDAPMMTLWHVTTPERAMVLTQHGTTGTKPVGTRTKITSPEVAKMLGKNVGDYLDYEPGRGMGSGLYLSRSPDVTFGTVAIPVKVRQDELAVPPERAARIPAGMTPMKSLNVGDGYTEARLGPERFGAPQKVAKTALSHYEPRQVPVGRVLGWKSADAVSADRSANLPVSSIMEAKRALLGHDDLVADVKAHGINKPLVKSGGLLVDGHRRLAAGLDAGLKTMPVVTVRPEDFYDYRDVMVRQAAAIVHCDICNVDYPIDSMEEVHEHSKQAVARPARLYHYTSEMHLPAILSSGYLRTTESNVSMSGGVSPVVWFTDTPSAAGIGITEGFKDAVEIVIDTPPDAQWWPQWSHAQGIEQFWYDALAKAAGGSPERWWVVPHNVPVSSFLSVKVHGKSVKTASAPVTLTVSYRRDPNGNPVEPGDAWVIATAGQETVGGLRWNYHMEPPQVLDVQVEPNWQRQGIATAMWAKAKENESRLQHSDSLTDDGRAFMQSLSWRL